MSFAFQTFYMLATFVHPEYGTEVKAHLENLCANLTGNENLQMRRAGRVAGKPDEWLREAEWNMKKTHSAKEKKNKKRD